MEQSGISTNVLNALDNFKKNVPPIPTTLDSSRKIPIRNMRKWISDLELPAHNQIWHDLVDVLRTDTSVDSAWGTHWDHDLCRFILGDLVSAEDVTKHRADKKQSRQAVNNAIKRELTCPIESGSSSRSKTFRDLFREKCAVAGVKLPELESAAKAPKPAPVLHIVTPTALPHADPAVVQTGVIPHLPSVSMPPSPAGLTSLATPITSFEPFAAVDPMSHFSPFDMRKWPSERDAEVFVARFRDECPAHDEWGRTAWWELRMDRVVIFLPIFLAVNSLYELRTLLLDFRWMMRTFQCVDYTTGMRQVHTDGYDALLERARREPARFPPSEIEGFRLIRNALMLIAPILAKDSSPEQKDRPCLAHLATQLVGRLLNLKRRFPNIACLIQSIEAHAPRPWLRPLTTCFQEPRTDIRVAVPSNGTYTPHLIALSDDGTLLAVSGSNLETLGSENTASSTLASSSSSKEKKDVVSRKSRKVFSIRIWDVGGGKLLRVIEDIPSVVLGLSIARDQSCIIANTFDSLFFWQLERTGDELVVRTRVEAVPKPKPITSVTPTVNCSRVLTTARSKLSSEISLWDTKTGKKVKDFLAVKSLATCIDVSKDGECFASGHNNGFVHLWNLGQGELEPVLSFKNEGTIAENGQQHVVLKKVNEIQDCDTSKTMSISFFEKGSESWLATVSKDEKIRVWGLPPRSITRKEKAYVSALRIAVLSCPKVRVVQWSQQGYFFSAGDDFVARMWSKSGNGKWTSRIIEGGDRNENPSDISSVFISTGKCSEVVATYMTKSPYVTVWDMSKFAPGQEYLQKQEREMLYRPYFSMVKDSVDASDVRHPADMSGSQGAEICGSMTSGVSKITLKNIGDLNNATLTWELQRYFRTLDVKNSTRLVGEMQTRLTLSQEHHWTRPLEVCFEQPVMHGVSGIFRRYGDSGATERPVVLPTPPVSTPPPPGAQKKKGRHGMAAALHDGTIAIFEVEDHDGTLMRPVKDETGEDVTQTMGSNEYGGAVSAANGQGRMDESEKKVASNGVGTSSGHHSDAVVVIDGAGDAD